MRLAAWGRTRIGFDHEGVTECAPAIAPFERTGLACRLSKGKQLAPGTRSLALLVSPPPASTRCCSTRAAREGKKSAENALSLRAKYPDGQGRALVAPEASLRP